MIQEAQKVILQLSWNQMHPFQALPLRCTDHNFLLAGAKIMEGKMLRKRFRIIKPCPSCLCAYPQSSAIFCRLAKYRLPRVNNT